MARQSVVLFVLHALEVNPDVRRPSALAVADISLFPLLLPTAHSAGPSVRGESVDTLSGTPPLALRIQFSVLIVVKRLITCKSSTP